MNDYKEVLMSFEDMVAEAEQMIDRRNPEAYLLAKKIWEEAIETGKPRHYAQANYIMAFYNCLLQNDYDKAIRLCNDVLLKIDAGEILDIEYKLYMTLGNSYQLKGDVFSAQIWYLKGLKLLKSKQTLCAREKGFLASFYYNMSLLLSDSALQIPTEEYLQKAIALYEELGEPYKFKLSKSYTAYASHYEQKKDYATAVEIMGKALKLDVEPYSIALSKANLGILHTRIGDLENAATYLTQALNYFENKNLAIETAMVKANYGEILIKQGEFDKGIQHLFDAEQMFEKQDNRRELSGIYEMAARFLEEHGDFKLALHYNRKYIVSLKEFFDVEKTKALTHAKREFETEQKEKEADILRQKNEEIKRYVFKLERSNSELKQFAHVASHDLREPLRMISSYITLLNRSLQDKLSTQQTEFIGFIADASKRMDKLIADLLRLAKVDAYPRKENVKLNSIIEEVKLNLEILMRERKAVILHSDLPDIIADRTMMSQLFQNIIGNGIKYNENQKPTIIVKSVITGDNLEILISDNGIGIPEHERKRAFMIFSRLNTEKIYQGTGIGLAICKKIVEGMEGEIGIETNPTGGTIFKILLPLTTLLKNNL